MPREDDAVPSGVKQIVQVVHHAIFVQKGTTADRAAAGPAHHLTARVDAVCLTHAVTRERLQIHRRAAARPQVQLDTLQRAARAVGRALKLELV
jgi:hypothetical protein